MIRLPAPPFPVLWITWISMTLYFSVIPSGGEKRRELSAPLWKATTFPVRPLFPSARPAAAVSVPVQPIWNWLEGRRLNGRDSQDTVMEWVNSLGLSLGE